MSTLYLPKNTEIRHMKNGLMSLLAQNLVHGAHVNNCYYSPPDLF